jgi:hypothetical protein
MSSFYGNSDKSAVCCFDWLTMSHRGPHPNQSCRSLYDKERNQLHKSPNSQNHSKQKYKLPSFTTFIHENHSTVRCKAKPNPFAESCQSFSNIIIGFLSAYIVNNLSRPRIDIPNWITLHSPTGTFYLWRANTKPHSGSIHLSLSITVFTMCRTPSNFGRDCIKQTITTFDCVVLCDLLRYRNIPEEHSTSDPVAFSGERVREKLEVRENRWRHNIFLWRSSPP